MQERHTYVAIDWDLQWKVGLWGSEWHEICKSEEGGGDRGAALDQSTPLNGPQ